MWKLVFALVVLLVVIPTESKTTPTDELALVDEFIGNSRADGDACLVCVFGLAILEENLAENAAFWVTFLEGLCTRLPTIPEQQACELALNLFGVDVIIQLLQKYNPNYVCGPDVLNICVTCSVDFVQPVNGVTIKNKHEQNQNIISHHMIANWLRSSLLKSRGDVPPEVLPAEDLDGDYFSAVNDLRRTAKWRGRDCNDLAADIHPGYPDASDGIVDNNCNGIVGKNPNTLELYENEYCGTSEALTSRRSVVIFGDSAAAAFRIPVEWLDLKNLTTIPQTLIQEFDFPHQSWATGYYQIGNDSLYLNMREQNLCNHLDFQNLAKNGAVMEDLYGYQVSSLQPSQYPLLAVVAYIGNDVCSSSLEGMTQPSDFYQQAVDGLNQLNSVSVPGTKVLLSGLVDGRILWDTLYNRIHPLGMTYEDFYNFLSCCGANPCWTWLNSDEAVRNATSFRAYELSQELVKISENATLLSTWPNLEVDFIPFPVEQIVNFLTLKGEDPAVLIEPVDGFHPSQYSHRLISKVVWEWLLVKQPGFVGNVNPNNPDIASTFPDQGPY